MSTELQPWQQRVVEEKETLDEKRKQLYAYLLTPAYHALPDTSASLLFRQSVVMSDYSKLLGKRIKLFKEPS